MSDKIQDVIKKQQKQKVQPLKKDEDTLQVVGFNVGGLFFAKRVKPFSINFIVDNMASNLF